MGNPFFKEVADTISGFAGDVADAWSGAKDPVASSSTYLSYPYTLGDGTTSILDFNSDVVEDAAEYSDARSERQKNSYQQASDPFIMFEFLRVIEPEDVIDEVDRLGKEAYSMTLEAERGKGRGVHNTDITKNKFQQNILNDRKKVLEDSVNKRKVSASPIVLYMTPSINISDTMSYDQENRKLAAIGSSLLDNGVSEFGKEDLKLGSALAMGAVVGAAGNTIADSKFLKSKLGSFGKLLGVGGGATLGKAIGDEMARRMGKVLNPNEYMQYKNTQLRSFTFSWKFLPDSIKESVACTNIIATFRGAAHANRKSPVTLTVPDQVITSFHGVDGMVNMPPTVISNVSVTYNPNAASFFKADGKPVEIDLSITLNEIMPIYRDDVEKKGY